MLQSAGIARSVITLGHAAHLLEAEVRKHTFDTMAIEFVLCESSSWKRGHASNILAARSMFQEDEPFLLVMSDHIFDQRLLRRCAAVPLLPGCACVLVDESTCMVDWAKPGGAHCKAHCRNGHCGSLVKVLKGEGKLVSRIGKSLTGFDALEAGAYVVTPCVFEVLRRLLVESIYCTLAEAMQVFASKGKLSYVLTDELDWFSEQTVASLHTRSFSTAVEPEWRERALAMLRVSSPHLSAENPWTTPLYDLGQTIGAGSTSVVIQGNSSTGEHMAFSGSSDDLAGMGGAAGGPSSLARRMARRQRGLAVKVVRKGATEGRLDDVERLVMWEVHVLQRLSHNHIVRVMDVIEVVDATYIVMERVDGPELTEYIYEQPNRRLPPSKAILLFSHVLSALRHAHSRGILHCDVKPDNVRLSKACDHAVLTDWGYARQPGTRTEHYMCGTPAYASPEQLTGYSPDSVTGRRKLCPATDVWSLGVMFYEMVTGALPFDADDYHTLVKRVLATSYQVPDWVEHSAVGLISSMLQLCPSDRASIDELCHTALVREAYPQGWTEQLLQSASTNLLFDAQCGACDDGGGSSCGVAALVHRVRGATLCWWSKVPPACRQSVWLLLYGAMCTAALWSQMYSTAEGAETVLTGTGGG